MDRAKISEALDYMAETMGTKLVLDELASYLSTDTLTEAIQYISTNWCIEALEEAFEEDEDKPKYVFEEDEEDEAYPDED